MTNKLTPASGTNQYKETAGGQGLHKKIKSLNPEYTTNNTYTGVFEFAKAQHKYYSESTAESRAETYQPWKKDNEDENSLKTNTYLNISKDDMLTINSHIIQLLNDTFKKEMDKNIELENILIEKESYIDVIKEENAMYNKRLKELDRVEKNRKDPKHREQLIKYSLLMLFGFIMFGLIKYL